MKGKSCGSGKMSKGYAAGGKTSMQMMKLGRGLAKVANQKKTGGRRGS